MRVTQRETETEEEVTVNKREEQSELDHFTDNPIPDVRAISYLSLSSSLFVC